MSNNEWRCDTNQPAWAEKGEDCSAEARMPGFARAYRAIDPAVMGLQEVSPHMAELLMGHLKAAAAAAGDGAEYEFISGGDTPIIYRRDLLKLLESGFFRYDEAVPGLSGSFNNAETKSWCWAAFEVRATGRRFAFMTTHLWWKSGRPESPSYQEGSAEARAYQIGLACARMEEVMAKYACPGFLVGDLNASVHSLCLEKAFSLGWKETHAVAEGDVTETVGYHACGPAGWQRAVPGPFDKAIDHILVKGEGVRVKYLRRLEDEYFDVLSDHYPLYIDAEPV